MMPLILILNSIIFGCLISPSYALHMVGRVDENGRGRRIIIKFHLAFSTDDILRIPSLFQKIYRAGINPKREFFVHHFW